MTKKVLILGSRGYIGNSLELGLRLEGYDILGISRKDFDMTDIRGMTKWFSDKYFDVVVNATTVGGSRLQKDDSWVLDQNLRMHYNLMANRDHYSRVISFGSGAEVFAPETPYGMSKRIITQSMMLDPEAFVIRIFAVFDENELATRFIKANMKRYIEKKPMQVHSNKIMDFFYMGDLINVVRHYVDAKSPPKVVNCSYEKKNTLLDVANTINRLSDHQVPIQFEEQHEKSMEFYCGTPHNLPIHTIGLQEGIRRTYEAIA